MVYVLFFQTSVSPSANLTSNVTHSHGDMALLECTSLGGPGNTYQWQVNGSLLNGETSGTLTLHNVTASKGGMCICVVSNLAGSASASTFLFVTPYFVNHPLSYQAAVGSTALLICDAVSFPNPEYHWQRADGRAIRSGTIIEHI